MAREPSRGRRLAANFQARCGETVAARVVFAALARRIEAEIRGGARVYGRGVVELI